MIITSAGGKTVLRPADLLEAEQKSGNSLPLTVVNPGSGKKGEVTISLSAGR